MPLNVTRRNVAIAVGLPGMIAAVNQGMLLRLQTGERLADWEVIGAWSMLAAQVLATSVVSGRFATGVFRWLIFVWSITCVAILATLVAMGMPLGLDGMYYVGFHRGIVSGVIVAGMLSGRHWLIRLPILAVVVVTMHAVFLQDGGITFREVESTLTVVAICAALRWQGFRLVHARSGFVSGAESDGARLFTLRQIFILMAAVAVVVAVVRSRAGFVPWALIPRQARSFNSDSTRSEDPDHLEWSGTDLVDLVRWECRAD